MPTSTFVENDVHPEEVLEDNLANPAHACTPTSQVTVPFIRERVK